MTDTLVKPIERGPPSVAIIRRSAKQANQPVQHKIVGPPSAHSTTRTSITRPISLATPEIVAELAEVKKVWRAYQSTNSRDAVYIYWPPFSGSSCDGGFSTVR